MKDGKAILPAISRVVLCSLFAALSTQAQATFPPSCTDAEIDFPDETLKISGHLGWCRHPTVFLEQDGGSYVRLEVIDSSDDFVLAHFLSADLEVGKSRNVVVKCGWHPRCKIDVSFTEGVGPLWVAASGGDIPDGAISAGVDRDGNKLYVCRIPGAGALAEGSCGPYCNDMKTPGRLVEGENFCAAEIRGPINSTEYEVLVSGNVLPENAPLWVGPFDFPEMNNPIVAGVEMLQAFYPAGFLSPSPNLICRVVDKTEPSNVALLGLGKRVGETRVCQYVSGEDETTSMDSDAFPNPEFPNVVEFLINPRSLPANDK
jgi:hypothetical protein